LSSLTQQDCIAQELNMASDDAKGYADTKVDDGSPGSVGSSGSLAAADVEVGQASGFKRRLPRFSLQVRQEESSFATTKNASNADFDPIPPSKRTWTWKAYVAYWMADAWAVSNWQVGEYLFGAG
jgi:NCS1 family nucleobase:cation symporter-1